MTFPTKRRPASKKRKAEIMAAQGGDRCAFRDDRGEQCTMPIAVWEHGFHSGVPVGLGNRDMPDAGLCAGHAYLKTVNEDLPRITKADRQGERTGQQARRRRRKEANLPPPIPTRPFQGGRKFNGEAVFYDRPRSSEEIMSEEGRK